MLHTWRKQRFTSIACAKQPNTFSRYLLTVGTIEIRYKLSWISIVRTVDFYVSQTEVECDSIKNISVFTGDNTELTSKYHYGVQSSCGEKGCSVHVDNETPCQGCVNGQVTVVRSILSGKTYVSCHGEAEFECQTNDWCLGTAWYGDVVKQAKNLKIDGEERTLGDDVNVACDQDQDGERASLISCKLNKKDDKCQYKELTSCSKCPGPEVTPKPRPPLKITCKLNKKDDKCQYIELRPCSKCPTPTATLKPNPTTPGSNPAIPRPNPTIPGPNPTTSNPNPVTQNPRTVVATTATTTGPPRPEPAPRDPGQNNPPDGCSAPVCSLCILFGSLLIIVMIY